MGERKILLRLTRERLDPHAIWHDLSDPQCGGVVVFVGRVRDDHVVRRSARPTILFYEAYLPLARKELKKLAIVATMRFEVMGVEIQHRLGRVSAGEPAVIVGVAGPHRKEAFAACEFIMDGIKKDVPIWKTSLAAKRVSKGHSTLR